MPRRGNYERGCRHKKAIASYTHAAWDARQIQRKSHEPMQAYRCTYCGFWHVGHAETKREFNTIKRRISG